MVVLLDFTEEPLTTPHHAHYNSFLSVPSGSSLPTRDGSASSLGRPSDDATELLDRGDVNLSNFSAALRCYPVVLQIARYLDLNDLHSISATCRQFRANLLPLRHQLISQTLRCTNETFLSSASLSGQFGDTVFPRLVPSRVGPCARDLVSPCQACRRTVCRNCTAKSPAVRQLKNRHRRLCPVCVETPLKNLAGVNADSSDSGHSFNLVSQKTPIALTSGVAPCQCTDGVHLCVPCGSTIHTADTTYGRVWTWRTRYGNIGGMYNGIGEGNEGVECGRGSNCFAATDIEMEVDVDSVVGTASGGNLGQTTYPSTASEVAQSLELPLSSGMRTSSDIKGPIYGTREIQGIGGVVKKKLITSIRIGACVPEWDEERENCSFLSRERKGLERSWCSWCKKIIPGPRDKCK